MKKPQTPIKAQGAAGWGARQVNSGYTSPSLQEIVRGALQPFGFDKHLEPKTTTAQGLKYSDIVLSEFRCSVGPLSDVRVMAGPECIYVGRQLEVLAPMMKVSLDVLVSRLRAFHAAAFRRAQEVAQAADEDDEPTEEYF